MHKDVISSRLAVSRRRALALGGTVGVGALLAGCGDDQASVGASSTGGTTSGSTPTGRATSAASGDVVALLDQAGTCTLAQEETQGPYWFDVDSIRSDLREDRPGTTLDLAVRVQDMSRCSSGGVAAPVADCVVEIWHCDAGGVYSGFESGSMGSGGGAPPAGEMPSGSPGGESGATSDGSYSEGDMEAATSDDGTYLRGAQVADAKGIAQFTTIYPGWYSGRTVHIHLKVHVDKVTVLTTQLFFDDALNDAVFATSPYDDHTGRDTTNDTDTIFDSVGLVSTDKTADGYLAAINLGVDV